MFVIQKMDFRDKSNEIYGYLMKLTGIYTTLNAQINFKIENFPKVRMYDLYAIQANDILIMNRF